MKNVYLVLLLTSWIIGGFVIYILAAANLSLENQIEFLIHPDGPRATTPVKHAPPAKITPKEILPKKIIPEKPSPEYTPSKRRYAVENVAYVLGYFFLRPTYKCSGAFFKIDY